jgi:multidrug efflux system membrane fusion protein
MNSSFCDVLQPASNGAGLASHPSLCRCSPCGAGFLRSEVRGAGSVRCPMVDAAQSEFLRIRLRNSVSELIPIRERAFGSRLLWSAGRSLMIVALFALLLVSGCSKPAPAAVTPPAPSVRVTELTEADVVDYEYFTGRTDATETVEVRARVTGYITNVGFKPGDEIKKGQLLFQIDQRPYLAELKRVSSQVLLNQARLKLADADVSRTTDISKTPGAISKQDVDRYLAARAEADASLKSAEAMVDTAKLNIEFTNVISPIAGKVGRNLLTNGNLVVQDQTLLTTVVSEDPIFLYFDVDERTMLRVQKLIRDGKFQNANEVEIRFGVANETDQYPHSAKLDFVNNRINASTGTLQIRAVLANLKPENDAPRLLTPGMFLRIRLAIGNARKGLVIPQAGIGSDQSRKYLLVVNKADTVEYRPVAVGPIQPDGRQLVEPVQVVRDEQGFRIAVEGEKSEDSIKPGEKVIVSGMQRVRAGIVVQPKPFTVARRIN